MSPRSLSFLSLRLYSLYEDLHNLYLDLELPTYKGNPWNKQKLTGDHGSCPLHLHSLHTVMIGVVVCVD